MYGSLAMYMSKKQQTTNNKTMSTEPVIDRFSQSLCGQSYSQQSSSNLWLKVVIIPMKTILHSHYTTVLTPLALYTPFLGQPYSQHYMLLGIKMTKEQFKNDQSLISISLYLIIHYIHKINILN